jgi:penicillin-binding protein 1B
MYQTIASGGFRAPLRAIREVTTQEGQPLKRYPLAVEQVFPPETMYLLAFAMQDVVHEGTAQSLKNWLPVETGVAGKTGTTDEQRDAWFAGFTGDRLGVVWIGYDDNRPAKLSGAASALPVWGEMMAALAPEPLVLAAPDSIELVSIDVQTGLRGGSGCPGAMQMPFIKGSAPAARAPCAGDATMEAVDKAVDAVKETVAPMKNWLQRLFRK